MLDKGQAIGARLARGDESALEDAYAAYSCSLLSFLRRYVGADEAEDVLQRTFLDVWRCAARYDPAQRFSTWLFTLAHRRAVDTLRTRRHQVVDIASLRDLVGEDGRDTVDKYADAADVRTAVRRLPDHEREVIELAYFGELTQREIASALDVPLGTVKARAARGTRRLGAPGRRRMSCKTHDTPIRRRHTMRFRSTLGSATAVALLAGSALVAGSTPAQAASARDLGTTSLASVLGADGQKFDENWKDFDIVEAAVYAVAAAKPKSPVLLLADGTKRLTAFAPTDKAFRNLAKDLTGKTYTSEKKVFNKLASLVDVDTLEMVLLYHVVPGATIRRPRPSRPTGPSSRRRPGRPQGQDRQGQGHPRRQGPRHRERHGGRGRLNKGNKQIGHGIDVVLRPADL